eukprot:Nitzschia sp. Nitz4//scaffold270_size25879//23417//24457//NITZ4_008301-RA/size25879-processed-gene-0.10-mRNA-1//-1//CDS//3329545199//512//frame0
MTSSGNATTACHATPPATPKWPQHPLLVRPSPGSNTQIKGIRRSNSLQYESIPGFPEDAVPVNCGREKAGESLVVDFESTYFVGTMLLRIKQAPPNLPGTTYQEKSYFDGKKRKFQVIIRGRVKDPNIPMSETFTGQSFDRPAGKLPAAWIINAFIQFITTLAPQLEVQLDTDEPRFLTPLVATAHTVLQHEGKGGTNGTHSDEVSLDKEIEEPSSTDPSSVLPEAHRALGKKPSDTSITAVLGRMKARKKALNSLAAKRLTALKFQTNKEYTFEFYQHLLDFGDDGLAVDIGRPIGKMGIAPMTNGQPLKIMSAHRHPETGTLGYLWCFDIWHASLLPLAHQAEQ